MILIQVILLAAFAFLFVMALRSRSAHSVNAWKKMAFVALMAVVVIAVLAPDTVGIVAQAIGVGRGADLVLYLVSVTFGFYVVNQYLRGQESRNQLHQLARRIAILEAQERYGMERLTVRDSVVTARAPETGAAGQTENHSPHA
jgi:small membrane protein